MVSIRRSSTALYTEEFLTGYSYKTDQYGLAMDSIVGFNLVLPNGTLAYVTQSTQPALFFGLKGGFNNFVSNFSSTTLLFGSTHRVPGDCNGFHVEGVPSE